MNLGLKKMPKNKIRNEIMFFAQAMEDVMRKHDGEKGNSWKDMSYKKLQELLFEEVEESKNKCAKIEEWIDISNFCMMIYCNTINYKGKNET